MNKVTVVLQKDMAKENESNWLLDFSQVRGPLNKETNVYFLSASSRFEKQRLFIHIIRVAQKARENYMGKNIVKIGVMSLHREILI